MLPEKIAKDLANNTKQRLFNIVQKTSPITSEYLKIEITCEKCEFNDKCESAWDAYNTNGDCLVK